MRAAALQALWSKMERLYVADSLPTPVCKLIRHSWVQLLSEDDAKFGRSAKGWFFGFQLHALIHQPSGVVITMMLLPGSRDDREAAKALANVSRRKTSSRRSGLQRRRYFRLVLREGTDASGHAV